jgi:hypothetical protein
MLDRRLIAPFLTLLLASCTSQPQAAPARPPLQDDLLDRLVGRWAIARAVRGTTVPNEMEAHWVLGHQFVQMHMTDPNSPPQYEAIVLIGVDTEKRRYVAHWCDTFGGGYSSIGYGTRTGDSVEFVFGYDDGPFYNTFTWRPQDHSWTFRGENGQKDGSRKLFMEDHATRR